MGCDIHIYVEYSTDGEHYELYASPEFPQSYMLFYMLAGVRKEWVTKNFGDNVETIFDPRGIPENASFYTLKSDLGYLEYDERKDAWNVNPTWHSTSYLSLEEFKTVIESYKKYTNDREIFIYEATINLMEALPHPRVVFWFDN